MSEAGEDSAYEEGVCVSCSGVWVLIEVIQRNLSMSRRNPRTHIDPLSIEYQHSTYAAALSICFHLYFFLSLFLPLSLYRVIDTR